MSDDTPSYPPKRVLAMLCRAAMAKGLCRGRREAVLSRLEGMGADLFGDCGSFFAAIFRDRDVSAVGVEPRDIGDVFLRQAFDDVEKRREQGSFYTPIAVIDQILDLVRESLRDASGLPKKDAALCDPAMGCGYFLLRAVERFQSERPDAHPAIRNWAKRGLYGVDRDPAAVFLTRAFLWLVLSDAHGEFIPDPRHFVMGDSLSGRAFGQDGFADALPDAVDWEAVFPEIAGAGGFSCIVGNPPYEVLTNFGRRPESRQLAERLRESGYYHSSLSRQVNLYRCFVERSLDLLRPGGTLSMIVPLSLARDASALELRKRLLEREAAGTWLLFGEKERLFAGVTQSACIFKAVRSGGGSERVRVDSGGVVTEWPYASLKSFGGGDPVLPILEPREADLWVWLWENCPGRLTDAADMRVGEVDQTIFRECMRDDDTGCVLARGAHLAPFRLDVLPVPGRERFLDLPLFLEKRGRSAEACVKRASVWRVAQLGIRNLHSRPRLIAALVPPGVYLGNSLNAYIPHDGVPAEYLAGLLNSRLLDWLFRVGSGNNNINLHEMKRLPIPAAPPKKSVDAIADAYRECADAALGDALRLARARESLDRLVEDCYGLPGSLRF